MSKNETMQFYTGKDYPHLCNGCKAMVDQCVEEIEERMALGDEDMVSGRVRLAFDDNEAPIMFAYDHKLMCGGHECECDCSIGFPLTDKHYDIVCRVHGGTAKEQQAFYEQECNENGHWFPAWTARLQRDGLCALCLNAYGRYEPWTS